MSPTTRFSALQRGAGEGSDELLRPIVWSGETRGGMQVHHSQYQWSRLLERSYYSEKAGRVHQVCLPVRWKAKVFYERVLGSELVATAVKRRCGHCGLGGAAVQCCAPGCLLFFHYACCSLAYLVPSLATEGATKGTIPDPLYFAVERREAQEMLSLRISQEMSCAALPFARGSWEIIDAARRATLGDIVRYFPQLHQQPPLQHDRLQLWSPHLFSACDASVLSVAYDMPGLPVEDEPLQVSAVVELEVLSPPHAAGDRFTLHYCPVPNGAPDCLVLLLDVQRGLYRLLLLQQQLITLQRERLLREQERERQKQEQQQREVDEGARRTPRRRVWMDGRSYSAFVRSIKAPVPEAKETARALLAAAGLQQPPHQPDKSLQDKQQQNSAVEPGRTLPSGASETRRLALASALRAVVGSEVYPHFVIDAISGGSGGSCDSSRGSRDNGTVSVAASDVVAWRHVASLGFEALEIQYLSEEASSDGSPEPSGAPQWLSPWEVEFPPGPQRTEELQLQQVLQQLEFPRERQTFLLQQLSTLMATPAKTSRDSSSKNKALLYEAFIEDIPEWRRLQHGYYRREAALHSDLLLVIHNCRKFNAAEPLSVLCNELERHMSMLQLLPQQEVQQQQLQQHIKEQYKLTCLGRSPPLDSKERVSSVSSQSVDPSAPSVKASSPEEALLHQRQQSQTLLPPLQQHNQEWPVAVAVSYDGLEEQTGILRPRSCRIHGDDDCSPMAAAESFSLPPAEGDAAPLRSKRLRCSSSQREPSEKRHELQQHQEESVTHAAGGTVSSPESSNAMSLERPSTVATQRSSQHAVPRRQGCGAGPRIRGHSGSRRSGGRNSQQHQLLGENDGDRGQGSPQEEWDELQRAMELSLRTFEEEQARHKQQQQQQQQVDGGEGAPGAEARSEQPVHVGGTPSQVYMTGSSQEEDSEGLVAAEGATVSVAGAAAPAVSQRKERRGGKRSRQSRTMY
ncbi:wd repeat domain-containing protein [Cyclospora cayetanensis]|uniref:Wd repeat domain-containing protein n=1 Tax=Cyclospora cayetanensis TaxID=88456 RepID=A0A1D3CYN2_9EIME|nr:wd repeat domain-containing protein [Cyclospora cayetanensis]